MGYGRHPGQATNGPGAKVAPQCSGDSPDLVSGARRGQQRRGMLLNHKTAIEFMVDAVPTYGLTTPVIQNPVESAFFLWVNLAYLQPFDDGTKRTSRLAANVSLMRYNSAPLSFLDVDV
ncbi:Fic family protein [Pseudomonas sp. MWU13-2100]|uniref:Fic family protein n=1 Tax=Pseudomonas sp. MWU13-2100 TaxID=2935075 RepID=UPI00200D87D1|nr:Fic family protein [Pseudomonas sp. MWU13-2100]